MRPVVFAGGGTGGHLYPALAIKEQLDAPAGGDVAAVFVCSDREIDASILGREGAKFEAIKARPISSSPFALAKFVLSWGGAVRAARAAIRSVGNDPIVIAMGGYVAAPAAQAARAEKAPVLLVNLDAVPGKANRWISRRADRVLTAAPVERSGWEQIPPIVRASAIGGDARDCRVKLGLDPDRKSLLVTGASQGARSINLFMAAFVDRHADLLAGWQVIHQCGKGGDEDDVRYAYEASSVRAHVTAFLDPMGPAWGAADLAVSRAGAGSVGEAWANRVPTVFMPYPFHKDQHQKRNAAVLVDAGGAVVARDRIEAVANVEGEAGSALLELLADDGGVRGRMRAALEGLGETDGAARVARVIQEMG